MVELGILIKKLRLEKGLTRDKLSTLVGYTSQHIYRIERGERTASYELLTELSRIFKIDIYEYSLVINKFNTLESYRNYMKIRSAIESQDVALIKEMVICYEDYEEFKSGEPLYQILYCKAIVAFHIDKDSQLASKLCYLALGVNDFNSIIELLNDGMLENSQYFCLLILASTFNDSCDYQKKVKLIECTINSLNQFVFNDSLPVQQHKFLMKKYLIFLYNNLAYSHYLLNNYEEAISTCDIGIENSITFNINNALGSLHFTKLESYFKLELFEEAKAIYNYLLHTQNMVNNTSKFAFLRDFQVESLKEYKIKLGL